MTRYILIYNSQKLSEYSSESVGKFFEGSMSTVHVVNKEGIDGGGGPRPPFDFVDVTSNKIKLKKVTYARDPSKLHRKVKKGLNIFGICQNKKCGAKGKEVIYTTDLRKEGLCFNINEEREKIICPICKTKFKKKTCGFWLCEYQFMGFYYDYEKGENIKYNSEPHETTEQNFEYFDPDENGSREWDELIVFVLPRQKIKYKK